jgi:hypothetical protein
MSYEFKVEIDREEDGRWMAEIPALPGVMAYGKTQAEGVTSVQALALRVANAPGPFTTPMRQVLKCSRGEIDPKPPTRRSSY